MYVIISIYGRDGWEHIRGIPLRLYRVPNITGRSHLMYKNVDTGLLRIRAQLGYEKCIWHMEDMEEGIFGTFPELGLTRI